MIILTKRNMMIKQPLQRSFRPILSEEGYALVLLSCKNQVSVSQLKIINSSKLHLPVYMSIMLTLNDVWEAKNGFAFSDFCSSVQRHLKTMGLSHSVKSILLRSAGFVLANTYPKLTSKLVLINLKMAFLRRTAWESWLQSALQKYAI